MAAGADMVVLSQSEQPNMAGIYPATKNIDHCLPLDLCISDSLSLPKTI
jgi:hypothetical protein